MRPMRLLGYRKRHLPPGYRRCLFTDLPAIQQELHCLLYTPDRSKWERYRPLVRYRSIEGGTDGDGDARDTEIDGPVIVINVGNIDLYDI